MKRLAIFSITNHIRLTLPTIYIISGTGCAICRRPRTTCTTTQISTRKIHKIAQLMIFHPSVHQHSQAFWRSPPRSRRSLPCNPASLSSAFWDPRERATEKACLGRQVGACGALHPCIWTSRAERASARVNLHSGKPFCSGFGFSGGCCRRNSPNWDRTHGRIFHRAQNDLQLSWSSGPALAAASTTGLLNKTLASLFHRFTFTAVGYQTHLCVDLHHCHRCRTLVTSLSHC